MLPRQYLPITGICHTNQLSGSEYEPACYGDIHHLASESLHNRNHRIYLQKMQVNIRSSMTLAPYVRKHRPWITSSQLYRSEERRVGKECVSTFRSGWWPLL